jgi:pimeloyl-ACP methyl ester carboxylesterase
MIVHTMKAEGSFVDLYESRMHYLDIGQGDVVVLAHSYLWSAEMWKHQIAILSQRYRVIAPDLWGHGGSGPMPAGTRSMRDLARQHLAFFDKIGVDRFSLVGHSIGGMWGAELALLAPHRVQKLVLMSTFLGAEPIEKRLRYLSMLDAVAARRGIPDGIVDSVLPLFFHPETARWLPELPAGFARQLGDWEPERLIDSVVPLGRLFLARRDLLDDVRYLRMPALVMTGSHDASRPPHEGSLMARVLGCDFIELPGAGHISALETPDLVNRYLFAFLENALPADECECITPDEARLRVPGD